MSYDRARGRGRRRLHASFNNTRTRIDGAIATPPQLAGFDQVLFDRIERRRIECGQPRDSVRLGGDWRRGRLGVNANAARYGEFCSFTANPADDQVFDPKWLTDAEVSFKIAAQLTVAAGVQNLFDVFPGRNITQNSFSGIQTFPSHSPFGMNGREWCTAVWCSRCDLSVSRLPSGPARPRAADGRTDRTRSVRLAGRDHPRFKHPDSGSRSAARTSRVRATTSAAAAFRLKAGATKGIHSQGW